MLKLVSHQEWSYRLFFLFQNTAHSVIMNIQASYREIESHQFRHSKPNLWERLWHTLFYIKSRSKAHHPFKTQSLLELDFIHQLFSHFISSTDSKLNTQCRQGTVLGPAVEKTKSLPLWSFYFNEKTLASQGQDLVFFRG